MNGSFVRSRGGSSSPDPPTSSSAPPLLYGSGAGALGWWRVRETDLRDSPSAELLHQAFRLQTLYAQIQQNKIQKVVRALRDANVEPILIKGWAIARFYPHQGLRP